MKRFSPSVAATAQALAEGRTDPPALLAISLRAVRGREAEVRAWSHIDDDGARKRAARLTAELRQSGARGGLHGVPFALKDIFDTAGLPTEWGSPLCKGRVPASDCALAARFEALGAVLVGKTHTAAFAYYDAAPTRNPHNPAHTPGGSSSGSAAAVACGMVPLAVGSQTQGSILRPASFCGVVGFKPTFGKLPLAGVMPFAPTLDHAGLFTADAADMQAVWRALGFAADAAPCGAVAAVDWPPPSAAAGALDDSMRNAFDAALRKIENAGLAVERLPCPRFFDALPAALRTVMYYEGAQQHGALFRAHGGAVGEKLAALLDEGLRIPRRDYRDALAVIHACRAAFAQWTAARPVIAAPAALGPAPAGLDSTGDPAANAPFTALGAPAISIPMGKSLGGLPLGLQLAAARGADDALLSTARLVEQLL